MQWRKKQERHKAKQLQQLLQTYQTPLFLPAYVFPLGKKQKEAATVLTHIAPLRMLYCLQAISDTGKVNSEHDFQRYFTLLYQYYLLSEQEAAADYLQRFIDSSAEYIILQEVNFAMFVLSLSEKEWKQRLQEFNTMQIEQLYQSQKELLCKDGPLLLGLLKDVFPDIIMQLQQHQKLMK